MLNMACSSSKRRKKKKLTSPFPSLLNYALSFIVIAVHRFRQVFESAHLLLSSMSLSLSLSHDVNYRFWMSSFSNYSGTDLLFFLSFPLYIYICMCVPQRDDKHGSIHVSCLLEIKKNRRVNEGCFVCKTCSV